MVEFPDPIKNLQLPFLAKHFWKIITLILIVWIVSLSGASLLLYQANTKVNKEKEALTSDLTETKKELDILKNEDQFKVNQELKEKIKKSEETYKSSIATYQKIIDLKEQKQDTKAFDESFADVLGNISSLNYASAQAQLKTLDSDIAKKYATIAAPASVTASTANIPQSNTPPASGGSNTQAVNTDNGTFRVSIISADLSSTKVIVDTASDSDCRDNCPVMALGDYAARSGAFAGINGNFFCPASYPSCAGKTNSFDTLVMNKNKHYFNSENNVYSTVPAAIFSGSARFVSQSLQWGRDTGVDSVIANHPLYILGGNNQFGGSGDPKLTSKGARTFIANKGNMVFIGIIYSASSEDAAKVLKAMGMDNAMGLDQGGSTALWHNGRYLAGPGRAIPNAVLFVRR